MTYMQIKMVAYLYLAGILVDLVWEILKIIDSKDYLKKMVYDSFEEIHWTKNAAKISMVIAIVISLAIFSGAWPITMHLDIWKKRAKGES